MLIRRFSAFIGITISIRTQLDWGLATGNEVFGRRNIAQINALLDGHD